MSSVSVVCYHVPDQMDSIILACRRAAAAPLLTVLLTVYYTTTPWRSTKGTLHVLVAFHFLIHI